VSRASAAHGTSRSSLDLALAGAGTGPGQLTNAGDILRE
jgi:hypothetical protein